MFWKKSKLLILYSTVDGHTKKICEYINKKLKNKRIISISSLEDSVKFNLEQFDEIVIGASVRYGYHRKNVYEFIEGIPAWNKKVFQAVEDMDKELVIITHIVTLNNYDNECILMDYKKKVIVTGFSEWKELCKLLQTVYNSLRDKRYTHLKKYMEIVHNNIKGMILKYQGLH